MISSNAIGMNGTFERVRCSQFLPKVLVVLSVKNLVRSCTLPNCSNGAILIHFTHA